MSGGLFEGVEHNLIGKLTAVAQGQMMNYSHMMMGFALAAGTLYFTWKGYLIIAGKVSAPVEDVIWDMMRMAIILSVVANVSGYLDGIIAAINGLKEGFSGSDNVWQLLDTLWDNAKHLGKLLHDQDNDLIPTEGMTAEFYVWLGTFILMIVTAFVSMIAEVMIMLLGITAPIFIFCLMYGVLRPMFNNWLQNIFAAILTILFSSLSLRIVIDYINSVMTTAIAGAEQANIVELGAQVCLSGICAAILVYFSAKLAGALAGASATASMQGLAAVGIGAGAFAAGKMAGGAARDTKRAIEDWKDRKADRAPQLGGGQGYSAAKARKYAIEQMIARNEMRREKGKRP